MKKPKRTAYCWVPGCWNKPITNSNIGAGRCPEHRYAMQPSKQGVQYIMGKDGWVAKR